MAAEANVIEWLIQRARSYIYTTGSSPMIAGALLASIDRILGVDDRGDVARDLLAVVDADGAVGPFGHDLDGEAVATRTLHPHQTETQIFDHGLGERRDAGVEAGYGDQARFVLRRQWYRSRWFGRPR